MLGHWTYLLALVILHFGIFQAFTAMQWLLERAPMLQPTAGLSRAELRKRWSDWRREVVRRKQAGEFTLVPPLGGGGGRGKVGWVL